MFTQEEPSYLGSPGSSSLKTWEWEREEAGSKVKTTLLTTITLSVHGSCPQCYSGATQSGEPVDAGGTPVARKVNHRVGILVVFV